MNTPEDKSFEERLERISLKALDVSEPVVIWILWVVVWVWIIITQPYKYFSWKYPYNSRKK